MTEAGESRFRVKDFRTDIETFTRAKRDGFPEQLSIRSDFGQGRNLATDIPPERGSMSRSNATMQTTVAMLCASPFQIAAGHGPALRILGIRPDFVLVTLFRRTLSGKCRNH